MTDATIESFRDPFLLKELLWPEVQFYDRQREVIHSAFYDDETFLVAGNMLGKDFTTAFVILAFFLTRSPCRVITTSAKEDHLRVLWGETGRFIQTSRIPLEASRGGPLIVNHREVKKVIRPSGSGDKGLYVVDKMSYLRGMVASADSMAAMQGHHIAQTGDGVPRTMFAADEASSVEDDYYRMTSSWANRMLVFGNAWDCDNFFRHAFKGKPGTDDPGGDIPDPNQPGRYLRRCIRIKGEDSPNVRLAKLEMERGREPSGRTVLPGVLPWRDYQKRRLKWDKIQQCVSIDADWWEGSELRLFPPEWLNRAQALFHDVRRRCAVGQIPTPRKAQGIGVDPAEGGDNTSLCAVDEWGIIEIVSLKTPNTDDVPRVVKAFIRKHQCPPHKVCFDRGGGGKQHADRMRAEGYPVMTVAFGEAVMPDLKRRGRVSQLSERVDEAEERYAYFNRRAEMYGEVSRLLDPNDNPNGYAIPGEGKVAQQLLFQLSKFPRRYDKEGRMKLPPKNKTGENSVEKSLTELIGHSPDEADSFVLAVYAKNHKSTKARAGAAI